MTAYDVQMVRSAEIDLREIYLYVAEREESDVADSWLNGLEEICRSLSSIPERGHLPPELERLGLSLFREIHYKPYRIIYQIRGHVVYIHCILDGRRDMQALLAQRLLRTCG